jgi:hypothetical protein
MGIDAVEAFRRTITVAWPRQMDAEAKALLLKTARDGHAGIMQRQRNPSFAAYANRQGNRNLDSVVLPGPIVYNYSNIKRIVEDALDELRKASPLESGDYARSHTIYVNGIAVETVPDTISPSDEIMIASPLPYSRKLEIGKTESGRDFLISVPNKIYQRVAKQILIPRYRNVVKIRDTFITAPGGGVLKHNQRARSWLANKGRWHYVPGQRKDRVAGASINVPAIIISQIVER